MNKANLFAILRYLAVAVLSAFAGGQAFVPAPEGRCTQPAQVVAPQVVAPQVVAPQVDAGAVDAPDASSSEN